MNQDTLPFVGIDDFAFKKRMTYGTVLIDLLTHKPLDMLNSREHEQVAVWLSARPEIKLITRDGSKSYAKAVREASHAIVQAADRWHILHQLFDSVKKAVYAHIPAKWIPDSLDETITEKTDREDPLRKSEKIRMENEDKRWARIQQVQALSAQGFQVMAIARELGISRGTVYSDLRQTRKPNHQRGSPYEKYRPLIHSLVKKGQTAKVIEEQCCTEGYTGSMTTLNTMIAKERKKIERKGKEAFSFRQKILSLIWNPDNKDSLDEIAELHPELLTAFPLITKFNELVHSFRELVKSKKDQQLPAWIERQKSIEDKFIRSFINGICQDLDAVTLGIRELWSNDPVEGQVNRLKTIKRMMYGRAGFDVLRNRFLYQW
ncbi:transposase [Sporosarcina sp. PTS2304]|uniref:transposase n=1 Tax=Sporosarcina sp. PTS2304 TaxID=2283194 RepID=UPI000E0D140C|nr:transposase [Sporosarcina sp. PTS2304]AXI00539.1 transposase [Sporosarcina sp. PTS2304]